MSRGEKKNDGNGRRWMSTFFKVAGAAAATAVVAGGLYIAMKQPKAEQVAFGSSSNEKQPEEEEEVSVCTKPRIRWVKLNVDGSLLPHSASAGCGGVLRDSSGNEKQPEEEEEEISVWSKPSIGWVKLNVDGSYLHHSESKSAGCGGVLRDSSGKWISGFAQKLDPTSTVDETGLLKKKTVDETEKEAILIGLKWADDKRLGVRKLAVESDNDGVVRKVNRGPSNTNDPLICEIRKLLFRGRYEHATLTWIPRKANQVADKLASNSHDSSSFNLNEYVSPPKNCLRALSIDGYY